MPHKHPKFFEVRLGLLSHLAAGEQDRVKRY
jgi:hypothetical protein